MEFIREYWWCFLILAVVISFAVVGLVIGHKDSKHNKPEQPIKESEKQNNVPSKANEK